MTTTAQWISGARPRTLPAAVAPVLVGTGVAVGDDRAVAWRALVAMLLSLALQVGVNYANDYSDGVRGTDADRVGPFRLVGSGAASPRSVRLAALVALGVGALLGLSLVAVTRSPGLLVAGLAAVLAAWFYTGGAKPYGYRALGEVAVFVFFGVVAVVGTAYAQEERWTAVALVASLPVGALACSLLVVNNLRDIPTDVVAGKRTLAVVLGDRRTRWLYALLIGVAVVVPLVLALTRPWALLALPALALAVVPLRVVASGVGGRALVPALASTGRLQLVYGLLLGIGLALGSRG